MATHASLEALPSESLERIVREVAIVKRGWNGLRILPLVSRTLFDRLQDLLLPVGCLRGQEALSAVRKGRWAAHGKSAWSVGEVDLSWTWDTQMVDVSALAACFSLYTLHFSTRVTDVSALACCSSLHTLSFYRTQVRDVSALADCSSLHTLDLRGTRVTDVSALASCLSLRTLYLNGTCATDVSALAACLSLRALYLNSTRVRDVSALAAAPACTRSTSTAHR